MKKGKKKKSQKEKKKKKRAKESEERCGQKSRYGSLLTNLAFVDLLKISFFFWFHRALAESGVK
jgi:hypothetical protein